MSDSTASTLSVPLSRIKLPHNVRELDLDHVAGLQGSIEVQGILVPLVVRPDGDDYVLVAGFHRYAAATNLKLDEVRVDVRDGQTEDADRAVENIVRKQLTPYEEARAVKAMLDRGLTEHGAAQALGWPKTRVTARMKILQLPERAQQLVGDGVIALAAVDTLRAIGAVSSEVLDAVVAYIDDGHAHEGERLLSQPGFVVGAALNHSEAKVFAAYLDAVNPRAIDELRLGKTVAQAYAEAEALHRKLDPHAYGPPRVRFSGSDLDQARAARVVIEFPHGNPIIVDKSVYRELTKGAIKRTRDELQERVAEVAEEKRVTRAEAAAAPVDPVTQAARDRDARIRQIADDAHGANLDLGRSLMNELHTVDPTNVDVARFFVYSLLGPDRVPGGYGNTGERIAQIAAGGVRLVVEQLRSDVTKTKQDGSRGRLRIDYAEHRHPDDAMAWLWKYVDGAKSAGDLYGRALVVIVAEQLASRLVVPASQRTPATRWSSHKDIASKALTKLAGPCIPVSLKEIERAVKRAHSEHDKAVEATHIAARSVPEPDVEQDAA